MVERVSMLNSIEFLLLAVCSFVISHVVVRQKPLLRVVYKNITKKLINAAATLDILVLDHLIISEKGYYSFKDESII